MFKALLAKITGPHKVAALRTQFANALGDGVLADDEIRDLSEALAALPVPEEERGLLRAELSAKLAEHLLLDRRVSEVELQKFAQFGDAIGLTEEAAYPILRQLAAGRILLDMEQGKFSGTATVEGVFLKQGERAYWTCAAERIEERTRREYVGGSRGVSIRLMKGVSYRTGAFRGHTISYEQDVPTSAGLLIATGERLIYTARRSPLELPYKRMLGLEVDADEISFAVKNRKSAVTFRAEPIQLDGIALTVSHFAAGGG